MKEAHISVNTENIFPIIKKFLYTDQEVFLRELVSNAVDATQKLKALIGMEGLSISPDDLKVSISIDKDQKTLTIHDNGLGMTEEEINKYINQLAFSGAKEFLEQYKDKSEGTAVIGHFGLGFYSAFMVADKVEIQTLSYKANAKPAYWVSEGSTQIKMGKGTRTERGTDIILHLNEESLPFLESFKVSEILRKYGSFLPVPIFFEDTQINDTHPIWVKNPQDITPEQYAEFHKKLYPLEQEAVFNIHLNVDYPFNLTGILYFPKISNKFEPERHKVQLYCNQVFVTDDVKDILPDYLVLLQGVIDSPDIPLNVSRSALQSDMNVKKITSHISKKVADKLASLFKNDRQDFENKWENLELFVRYGLVSDEKFYERASSFSLLKDSQGKFYTHEELFNTIQNTQKNKDGKTVLLYATNPQEQSVYIERATQAGFVVVELTSPVDSYYVSKIEEKWENTVCRRVDSDLIDNLIDTGAVHESVRTQEEEEKIKSLFESCFGDGFSLETIGMSPNNPPLVITEEEYDRRFRELYSQQAAMFGGAQTAGFKVKVNVNHPLVSKILSSQDDQVAKSLAQQAADLALLSKNLLKGDQMSRFVDKAFKFLEN